MLISQSTLGVAERDPRRRYGPSSAVQVLPAEHGHNGDRDRLALAAGVVDEHAGAAGAAARPELVAVAWPQRRRAADGLGAGAYPR